MRLSLITRRQWQEAPYVEDPQPWRRLAAAVLLQGCLDAHAGRLDARVWLHSDQAHAWAGLLDLPHWPPRLDQLAGRTALQRRASANPSPPPPAEPGAPKRRARRLPSPARPRLPKPPRSADHHHKQEKALVGLPVELSLASTDALSNSFHTIIGPHASYIHFWL
jgi:hypothetical protein